MPSRRCRRPPRRTGRLGFLVALWLVFSPARPAIARTITNLHQLTQSLSAQAHLEADLDLTVTVCAATRPELGVVIVRDETGFELLQMRDFSGAFQPGDRLRLRAPQSLLRKREMGVEISARPIATNDGLHSRALGTGEATLPAGKIPIRVEWFNFWRQFALDVFYQPGDEPPQPIPGSNLWHTVVNASGQTNFVPGLWAEIYEGSWETIPDFDLLTPVRSVVTTNFDIEIRTRNERVGIRYSGYLDVPRAGPYRFSLWSDDGSLLYLGTPKLTAERLGSEPVPVAIPAKLPTANFTEPNESRWMVIEGRVTFATAAGRGLSFDLGLDEHIVSVRVADAEGLDPITLRQARVRVTGIGRPVMNSDESLSLGKLTVATTRDLLLLDRHRTTAERNLPLTSVAEVQSLPIDEARKGLPVHIRGTVTGVRRTSQENWISFQDNTRGIFVRLAGVTNVTPALGSLWELQGRSGAGDFAPIISAEKLTYLGESRLPPPVTPTWAELLNGSRDVQWVELAGLVTAVNSNGITLHLPEGRLDVDFDDLFESEARAYLGGVVRIRGVLYALWNESTREVRVGRVRMRSATVSLDIPAPADLFEAVVRTPRELLLFDAQASAFRRVKVRGQIIYADAAQLFLQADGTGLRLLPTQPIVARPGDMVEAVGYPDLSKKELVLRQALVRTVGTAGLPAARELAETTPEKANVNSTRVRIAGKLLGWHSEATGPVLEMQAGSRLFLARINSTASESPALRPGSRLALEGVYVGQHHDLRPDTETESFELLLNSLGDIDVLSQPSWWTLPRLLALLSLVLVILVFTVIWNSQLRRQVEQRTAQLQQEIRARERLERTAALEAERSRIARDLHDDLGASLTEISVLASTGQLPQTKSTGQTDLFQSISSRARSLIAALDVIVWAVDPEDNSLQSLADYLTGYTSEFFSHTPIACRFKVPVAFPAVTLEGRVRHDLLMAVKEALNNVLRHADATDLEFRLAVGGHELEIDIADNGKGIAGTPASGSHGLKNLSARLKNLGGSCNIDSRPGGGTIVKIRLPLPQTAPAA